MPTMTLIEAIRAALRDEMGQDPRVIVLGEDVGVRGGVFRATQGLIEEFGEDRVIDTPLAESSIVGSAIGAALNQFRPVAEIQFADFIWPAVDQIISEAAKMLYRSRGDWGCPLVIRAPYGGGVHGALYHSQSVESFFAHVPGLKVLIPSDPQSAYTLLRAAIRDPGPVLFLEHKKLYRLASGEVDPEAEGLAIGRAVVRREGDRLTAISYGMTLHHCLELAGELEEEGLGIEVLDLPTIIPLDREGILRSVRRTGKVLIVHEDTLTNGIGAEIAATIAQDAFEYLDAPITRVAAPDVPAVPFSPPLEEEFLPGKDRIGEAMRRLAAY